MKRYLYLFPLMAITAASLTLGACDDKKTEEEQATSTEVTVPAPTENAAPQATPPAVETKVVVHGAGSFATAPGATTGAAFMVIENNTADADKIIAAKTDIAGTTAEIHENTMDPATNVMSMRKVDSIDVPAGQKLVLNPGGYHVMIMGLTSPLVANTTFNVTLTFEKAGDITTPVSVMNGPPPGGSTTAPAHDTMPTPQSSAPTIPDTTGNAVVPTETAPATPPATEAAPVPAEDAPAVTDEQPAE